MVYDFDSNTILAEPIKSRAAGEIKKEWEKIIVGEKLIFQIKLKMNLFVKAYDKL